MARRLARRQLWERLAGALIAIIGVAVLIVAIVALRNPKQPSTGAGPAAAVTTTRTVGPAPRSSSRTHSTSGSRTQSTSGSRTQTTSRTAGRATDVGSEPLIVLNNTGTANLARDAASRFERGGWQVSSFEENYRNDIVSTCAYFDPAVSAAEQAALALQKQYPTIKRVVPRFTELPSGPVVVVLTSDYLPN